MTDTNNMRRAIADEVNRGLDDQLTASGTTLATAITREINRAVKHYRTLRTEFNEVREAEFATTAQGTRAYSLSVDYVHFDTLKVKYNQSFIPLCFKTWGEIEDKDRQISGSEGVPYEYTIYGREIRLWPVPNGAYTLAASYVRSFPPVSATGSYTTSTSFTVTSTASHNNRAGGWFSAVGERLIRPRAKAGLLVNWFRDEDAIAEMRAVAQGGFLSAGEMSAYNALLQENNARMATYRIRNRPI